MSKTSYIILACLSLTACRHDPLLEVKPVLPQGDSTKFMLPVVRRFYPITDTFDGTYRQWETGYISSGPEFLFDTTIHTTAIITHLSDSSVALRMWIFTAFQERNYVGATSFKMSLPTFIELKQQARLNRKTGVYDMRSLNYSYSTIAFRQNGDSLIFTDIFTGGLAFQIGNRFAGKKRR